MILKMTISISKSCDIFSSPEPKAQWRADILAMVPDCPSSVVVHTFKLVYRSLTTVAYSFFRLDWIVIKMVVSITINFRMSLEKGLYMYG